MTVIGKNIYFTGRVCYKRIDNKEYRYLSEVNNLFFSELFCVILKPGGYQELAVYFAFSTANQNTIGARYFRQVNL